MDYDQLNRLFTAAIECQHIGVARLETLLALYKARQDKTTWFGEDELRIRDQIDAFLNYNGYQV